MAKNQQDILIEVRKKSTLRKRIVKSKTSYLMMAPY
ncbi:MAG TPA: ABC transporter permease, partial [Lachnoclostridium phytofermentans]|nr:ABC transporter permease [Lachnoclostridium phytofermentans]